MNDATIMGGREAISHLGAKGDDVFLRKRALEKLGVYKGLIREEPEILPTLPGSGLMAR